VRSEDAIGGGDLAGDFELDIQPVDQLAAALKPQEGGVALVHVPHLRIHAQRTQRAHATDT
jgi:hypothetical protein